MNSLDLVWDNKKFAETLRNKIFDYIKTQTKSEIQPGEPVFFKTNAPYEMYATAMLRVNIKGDTLAVFLGSPQAEFYKNFYETTTPWASLQQTLK